MSACAFPGCVNGADPRWGGYCDGHGATTEREVENRHSAIVAIATEAVELRTQLAALREQRRVLREALGGLTLLISRLRVSSSIRLESVDEWTALEVAHNVGCAALDATKEEP